MTPSRDREHFRAIWNAATIHTWQARPVLRGHRQTIVPVSRGKRIEQ